MNSDQDTLSGGLPHSEIPGSTIARISPGLFAACHVLHRLSVPRHPPDALTLRLSATPNGKHHLAFRCGKLASPGGTQVTSRMPPLKTLRDPTDKPARQTSPTGRPRSALGETSFRLSQSAIARAITGSRLGHTTRFFTICHQQQPARHPSPSGTDARPDPNSLLPPRSGFAGTRHLACRRLRLAFRRLLRKPLSAR